jgi:hydroxypyruvate isomerase
VRHDFKPSVCIDAVFAGRPLEEALAVVAQAGIPAFEFWGWWDRDLDAVRTARDRHRLQISACCTRFVSLTDPACRDAYLQGLADSIEAARGLDCGILISQVGNDRPGVPRADQRASLIAGLRGAAPMLEEAGITLVIEPLNVKVDHPGYFLVRSQEAFDIIEAVGSPHVKVVFDIYHQQISEGDLITTIRANIHAIGHFHAAGNPGRHELDHGEIHYPAIFQAIANAGFHGFVGLEYWPAEDPAIGLARIAGWFGIG